MRCNSPRCPGVRLPQPGVKVVVVFEDRSCAVRQTFLDTCSQCGRESVRVDEERPHIITRIIHPRELHGQPCGCDFGADHLCDLHAVWNQPQTT